MGEAKRRLAALAEFLARHPVCCFCGGGTPSATRDHFPCRALFDGRRWPEGYEFPACDACNAASRRDEMVVTLLGRMYPNAETKEEEEEFKRALSGVKNNFPGLLEKMAPSPARRLAFAARHRDLAAGIAPEHLPFIEADIPEVHEIMLRWGRKLACALHYLHTGRIVPRAGALLVEWYTNVAARESGIVEQLRAVMPLVPVVERARRDLSDQFGYEFLVADGGRFTGFACRLRQSLAFGLYAIEDEAAVPARLRAMIDRPLSPPAP